MSDIFKEVDEALQQEKLLNLWNEYKSTIVGAIVLLLVTASGTTFYKNWNFDRNADETARLINALDQNNTTEILSTLKNDTRKEHAAVATLTAASMALENNNRDEASKLYLEVANTSAAPKDLRDLARILYSKNSSEVDINMLKPVLSNKKSPWLWHAKIEAAVISADQGNYKEAINYLSDFDSQNSIPFALKQRADALKHVYTLKMAEKQTASTQDSVNE